MAPTTVDKVYLPDLEPCLKGDTVVLYVTHPPSSLLPDRLFIVASCVCVCARTPTRLLTPFQIMEARCLCPSRPCGSSPK
jgi:hypothetical protein